MYFEDGASKIFPNGTIIYDDGSQIEASVFYGAMDPKYEKWNTLDHELTNILIFAAIHSQ